MYIYIYIYMFMVNMENNVALPLKCLFYSRYVDDIITDVGKMNLMKFFMHSTTTMKILI